MKVVVFVCKCHEVYAMPAIQTRSVQHIADFVQLPEATRARLEKAVLHMKFSLVDRAKRPRDGPERENGIP
jgi:hypothetical protein